MSHSTVFSKQAGLGALTPGSQAFGAGTTTLLGNATGMHGSPSAANRTERRALGRIAALSAQPAAALSAASARQRTAADRDRLHLTVCHRKATRMRFSMRFSMRLVSVPSAHQSAVHEAAAHAAVTAGARNSQVSGHLNWIQQRLTRHAVVLRAEIPRRGRLTAYALHGAFVPPHIRTETRRPVITGFRARYGYLTWELGRVAFDVRTVAEGNDWQECAVALLSAYRCAYPALPAQELTTSSRVALLEMLCAPVMSALPMAWELRAESVRRLLDALPDLDEALRLCDGPMRQ
ncbi:hypothetical protein GCM10010306_090280 [Streptomyces umbrinus]|uniref:hypothetical protein n=1 Tax=Streptomyces umbrinus TaxID=67370 RepID=UPI001676A221|nr:hypothetical protein [Streptomyces umbrinus]GHB81810.1 hypothetical protein GCM10010306_090280 [Streptomyces umbrinus]